MKRERIEKEVTSGGNYFAGPKANLSFIPSGCKLLDLALGGGWAEGRIGNVVGDKSSGKTLLCIEACANFANKYDDGNILYRECEAAFDEDYAAALGMPLDRVDFGKGLMNTVEDMFDDISDCLKLSRKEPSLYILDSLDSLSDRAEMERDMDEGTYGTDKARKLSQMFRRLTRDMANHHLTMIIVSQVRSKIGVSFGKTTTRSGGRALDFYASQVVGLANIGTVKRTMSKLERITGLKIKAKVEKNKVGLPLRDAEFEIKFGYGVDDLLACMEWLGEAGSLPELGVAQAKIKAWVRETNKLPDDEYWDEVKRVHELVERRWYEVEQTFLPTRKKYVV